MRNNGARLFLLLAFLLMLPGCTETVIREQSLIASIDGMLVMAVNEHTPGEPAQFTIATNEDKTGAPTNWNTGKSFLGELIALLPDAPARDTRLLPDVNTETPQLPAPRALFIFHSGAVRISTPPYTTLHPLSSGEDLQLRSAIADEGRLLAVGLDTEKRLQVYAYDAQTLMNAPFLAKREESEADATLTASSSAWKPLGPPLQTLSDPAFVSIVLHDRVPYIFWRNSSGGQVNAGLWGSRLVDGVWQRLPLPHTQPRSTPIRACRSGKSILLVEGDTDSLTNRNLAVLRFEDDAWHTGATAPLPAASSKNALVGIDLCRWRDGLALTCTDGGGVRIFAAATAHGTGWKQSTTLFMQPAVMTNSWIFFGSSLIFILMYFWMRASVKRRLHELPKQATATLQRLYTGGLASPVKRGVAFGIDALLVSPFILFTIQIAGINEEQGAILGKNPLFFIIFFLCWIGSISLYAAIAEGICGVTVGKYILGIRVRNAEGGPITPWQAILRNLGRLIDFFPVPIGGTPVIWLVALLFVTFTRKRQRFGDLLARTVVLRHIPLKRRAFVLGSASPRRKELMDALGYPYRIDAPHIHEKIPEDTKPADVAISLAKQKAEAVSDRATPGEIVITADTIVVLEDEILGKPATREEAFAMLTKLSGKTHRVITGVAVLDSGMNQAIADCEVTEVVMRPIPPEEITRYIATGEADDKAGAYAIQGGGGAYVEMTRGSYSNVVGMPMELLQIMLKRLDG